MLAVLIIDSDDWVLLVLISTDHHRYPDGAGASALAFYLFVLFFESSHFSFRPAPLLHHVTMTSVTIVTIGAAPVLNR